MDPFSFNKLRRYKLFQGRIKTSLLVVFVLYSTLGYAQKLEGTIRFLNTVNYTRLWSGEEKSSVENEKDNTDSFISLLYFNATQTRYVGWDDNDPEESYRRTETTITRDFSKHTLHDIIDVLDKTYIIEDSLRAPRWIIKNDMKEIAGHTCMNAFYNDTLKHQKVMAWYALDIPLGGGPERYFGLPGLILEVNINNGAEVITADKIELKKLTTELDFPKKAKGKKIKEKDYIGILRKQIVENRKQEQPVFSGLRY